jgi:hypothetical protein
VPKQATTWLEPLLTQELRRVAAPGQLWDRVQLPVDRPIQPPQRAVNMWFACASSAALLLVSAVGLHNYLKNENPTRALRMIEPLRFQAVVSAACHLCHEGDDLQASAARGVY